MRLAKVRLFEGDHQIPAKFRNLTFDRVQVLTPAIFNNYSALFVVFSFRSGEQLRAYAKIAHQHKSIIHYYGIKFDQFNDKLGDCLVATQTDLIFV
jgi:hypothetical protein